MAAKSSFLNMTLCLSAVCLVCSALLASAFALTKDSITEAQIAKTNASIAEVLPAFEGDAVLAEPIELDGVAYTYYTAAEVGYAIVSKTMGFGGELSLMVGVTKEGIIYNTVTLSHSETPGLGAKCKDPRFADQFKQLDPSQKRLLVSKDGGDIDAITASTITSRAYTQAVENALKVYNLIIGSSLNTAENE